MTTTEMTRQAMDAVAAAVIASAKAVRVTARRIGRTLHAILTVTRRHVPAWVGTVLGVCLFIPGPLDELLVLIAVVVFAALKPQMRADFARTVPQAWKGEK